MGTQTPFTNLTFDWTCPEDLRQQHPVIGGETMPFTYGELQPEMDMINRAYIEVMMKEMPKGAFLRSQSPLTTSRRILIGKAKTRFSSLI